MINPKTVSCCLNTKESVYPQEILDHLNIIGFDEIIITTGSDSPHGKYTSFAKARNDLIYYQDDDAICPVTRLLETSIPEMINVIMKPGHYTQYSKTRMTMGLGWGSIFHKKFLKSLKLYTDVYGEDEVYKRETERILTYLNYPQNRIPAEVHDLPSAMAEDRLWRQPKHYDFMRVVEDRCSSLV